MKFNRYQFIERKWKELFLSIFWKQGRRPSFAPGFGFSVTAQAEKAIALVLTHVEILREY